MNINKTLANEKTLKNLLHKHKFFTKKNLGQNFLICKQSLDSIVRAANINKDDEILEIWPWPWVLTQALLDPWAIITALEVDKDVIPVLEDATWNPDNLEIINTSALEYFPKKKGYILCANIPYYLTSPILKHYLWRKMRPKKVVLLMQKEVAQKICCSADNESLLSLQVKLVWNPSIFCEVTRDKFFPIPSVDSSVLVIDVYEDPLIREDNLMLFWDVAGHLFNQKRKKVLKTLSNYRWMWNKAAKKLLEDSWVNVDQRPQTIDLAAWQSIVKNIKNI